MKTIQFTVLGTPVPQGSMKAFIPKGWNRAVLTSDNKKTRGWRQEIAGAADAAMRKGKHAVAEGLPVAVTCHFWFDKPKSTKKSVLHKITKPDLDKLARAALDAMTGTVYKDDSQVIALYLSKGFDVRPRAEITVVFDALEVFTL